MMMSPSPNPDDKEETSLMRVFLREGAKDCDLEVYALTLALALSKWAAAICLDLSRATPVAGGGVTLGRSRISDTESPRIGVRKTIP
jgi:hypothetical protein